LTIRKTYLANAIIRDLQEREPRKKVLPLPAEKNKRRRPVLGGCLQGPLIVLGKGKTGAMISKTITNLNNQRQLERLNYVSETERSNS
jgi:hypothetical protein